MQNLVCWSNWYDKYWFCRTLPHGARLRGKVSTCCGEYCTKDTSDFTEGVFIHSTKCEAGCECEFKDTPGQYTVKCNVYNSEVYALCRTCFSSMYEIVRRDPLPEYCPDYTRVRSMIVYQKFQYNPKSARIPPADAQSSAK